MLTKTRLALLAIFATHCVIAAEPVDAATPSGGDSSASVLSLKPASGDGDVGIRVAQRPPSIKSILRLDEKKKSGGPKEVVIPEPSIDFDSKEEDRALEQQKKVESSVDRRMKSLERSLKREESRLESRLQELGKKRDKALEKGDVEALGRIEKAEKQAVVDYDRRIERLLAAMAKSTPAPVQRAVGSKNSTRPGTTRMTGSRSSSSRSPMSSLLKNGSPSWNRSSSSKAIKQPAPIKPAAEPKAPKAPQKRRFKLWPFR